jgi:hypothetical protein
MLPLKHTLRLLLIVAWPALLSAQLVSSKGLATVSFGSSICGTPKGIGKDKLPIPSCLQPTPAEIQAAQHKAALNAVERFAAEGGESALKTYDRIRDSVETRYADIVLSVLELNRSVDSTARTLSVTVRAEISEARLRNLINGSSAIATGGSAKSQMGTFMLAREQSGVEQFGVEVRRSTQAASNGSRATATDSSRKVKEDESVKGGVVSLDDRVRASESLSRSDSVNRSKVTKNSTVQRSDEVQYRVSSAQDLDGVLSGRLSAAGFEMVEAAFFEDDAKPPLVDAVRGDFATGDDLKSATLRRMLAAAQKAEIRYALVGTVDLSVPSVDEVSGNQRVFAKVSAKVYDLSGRLPRTVVNVAPAQFAGLGPSASVAKVNALKSAGEATAREVLAQLNIKQIH